MLIAGKFFLKAWNGKTEILFVSFKCYLCDRGLEFISINLCSVTGYVKNTESSLIHILIGVERIADNAMVVVLKSENDNLRR